MSDIELHAIFHGRVQGVFFRSTTCQIARRMGLTGTVKNLPDGTVELYAQGKKEQLEELIAGLKREFDIESVETDFYEVKHQRDSFDVVY